MSKFKEQFDKQGRCCFYCHKPLSRNKATEDHFIPKSKGGGGYDVNNIVIACKECNQSKAAELPNLFHFHGQ